MNLYILFRYGSEIMKHLLLVNTLSDTFDFYTSADKVSFIVGVVFSCLILFAFTIYITVKVGRKFVIIFNSIAMLAFMLSSIFRVSYLTYTLLGIILFANYHFVRSNDGEFRKYVAKPLKKSADKKNLKDKKTDEKSVDMQKLISDLVIAVNWLSKNKVGALITFEKETPLDNYIKSGTIINCPFTPELVETIFYEGTRLHDGAIVIRNGIILAAAVYYQPSTKAVVGKFGARHRAALGISEVSDSITVIVSEETGRIAIAHNGMLDNVKSDEFEKLISNALL